MGVATCEVTVLLVAVVVLSGTEVGVTEVTGVG